MRPTLLAATLLATSTASAFYIPFLSELMARHNVAELDERTPQDQSNPAAIYVDRRSPDTSADGPGKRQEEKTGTDTDTDGTGNRDKRTPQTKEEGTDGPGKRAPETITHGGRRRQAEATDEGRKRQAEKTDDGRKREIIKTIFVERAVLEPRTLNERDAMELGTIFIEKREDFPITLAPRNEPMNIFVEARTLTIPFEDNP